MRQVEQIRSGPVVAGGIRNPTFIDVFAGCGGLSLGLMQAGWAGLFAIEKDRFAFSTLEANLIGNAKRYHFAWPDWLPVEPRTVGSLLTKYGDNIHRLRHKVDMLVGGPPCQGFSSAGRRDPNDPRNRLVSEYLRLVNIIEPKIVLIENVRGIASDFDEARSITGTINYADWICTSLAKHYTVHRKLLDISKFGVPQRRHRFFIVALRDDFPAIETRRPFEDIEAERQSFLLAKGIHAIPVSAKSAISDLELQRNGSQPSNDTKGFNAIAYIAPRTKFQKLMRLGIDTWPSDTRLARHTPEIAKRFGELIRLCHASGRLNTSISPEIRARYGLRKCAIRVLDPDAPSPTITSMPDDLIHYAEPRTLTVRENARLQSFPDWFEFRGKYTTGGDLRRKEVPRFTQVANAVPPLAAEAIGNVLKHYITRGFQE